MGYTGWKRKNRSKQESGEGFTLLFLLLSTAPSSPLYFLGTPTDLHRCTSPVHLNLCLIPQSLHYPLLPLLSHVPVQLSLFFLLCFPLQLLRYDFLFPICIRRLFDCSALGRCCLSLTPRRIQAVPFKSRSLDRAWDAYQYACGCKGV